MKKMGWKSVRYGSKHDIWTDGEREIAVPRHSEINEYTGEAILKDTGGKTS